MDKIRFYIYISTVKLTNTKFGIGAMKWTNHRGRAMATKVKRIWPTGPEVILKGVRSVAHLFFQLKTISQNFNNVSNYIDMRSHLMYYSQI
jgi:hypothetical protein